MTCNKQMIYIYRGDDTDWNNEQFVTVNITSGSSSIDLSTMSAVFTLGNFTQTYSLAEGSFQVSLSSEITRQFPYGPLMGSIKILDSQNRIKTATTDIPFYVTSEVITIQNQDLVIEVPGVSINVTIGGTVSYNDLLNKPSINGVTVEGSNAAEHYNLANKTDLDAHIANKNNPHEVTKAQIGLSNVDNTSDANKPISNATANALAGKVSKSGDTMTGNLTMSSGTEIEFPHFTVKENQAGNPIIGDGNGNGLVINSNGHGAAFFTNGGSSYTEVVSQKDVKSTYSPTGTNPVNGTAVASAISTKQDSLTPAQLNAVNSGIDSTKVSQIETNKQNIANEVINRQSADNGLQNQIDALSAASDVTDIVGTYAELQTYDTSKLKDNDIIKVLEDSTHDDASSYYRWSTHTNAFTYIGSEGPYTTPAQLQTGLDTKQDVISDLSTIRSGAELGATSVQPSGLETALATKQNTLSTTQMEAVNSGANSTNIGQIATNTSAISSLQSNKLDATTAESTYLPIATAATTYATKTELAGKQNLLTAGENIQIAAQYAYSGFSENNNIVIPGGFIPGSLSWEIVCHIRTGSDTYGQKTFFSSADIAYRGATMAITNGYFVSYLGEDTRWISDGNLLIPTSPDTEYYCKTAFDGINAYTNSISTDGITFTGDQIVTDSTPISGSTVAKFGYLLFNNMNAFNGKLYMPGTYIKVNGEYVFNGNTAVQGTDYTISGTLMVETVGTGATISAPNVATKTELASKLDITTAASTYVALAQKAAANGVATLDANTLIPTNQLPIIDGGSANA